VSALVVPLAAETGEAPEQVAAAGAEAPPVGFVTLLARCSGPPGSGGARPSGEDQATGARTAQSEGAVKDTDIAEQVAANASANGPATALAQLSLQVPPDGAPTHTDDAPEPAAGAHEARPSGAAAGLAGDVVAAASYLPAPLPQSQGAAAAAERPEAQPTDGTAAPSHAAAPLGGIAAAGAAGLDPAGARGHVDDVSLAAPAAAGSETAGAPAGERALAGLAAAAATTPQVQPRAQQRTAASVASPEVAKRAASDARVATPGHPAVSDWQAATPGHSAVSDRQVATPTHPGASDGAAAAPGKPAAAALETVQASPAQAPPAQTPSPVPQHPALAAPTAHARAAALPSTAAALVDVAVSARAARARIVLTPPELGTVEIRLRYGERGVSATFHADSSQAAQTLALAAGDLRRALEAQGIQVQQIDVPAARTDQQTPAWSGGGDGAWNAGRGHGSAGDAPASGGDPTTLEPDDPITHRAVLLGTAVDVLA